MSIENFNNIKEELSKCLKEKRFIHTLGVAYTAAALAMRYDYDMEKAYLAGLLHDCAKAYKVDDYINICKENNIDITQAEELCPQLLHSKLGSFFAKLKYGINDEEILLSIQFHTTGHPNMTLLEKIIYLADYIEPGRDKAERLGEVRDLAFKDIDKAILLTLEETIKYISQSENIMDPITKDTYDYYKRLIDERD